MTPKVVRPGGRNQISIQTTMAAVLGTLPIALAIGAGAELRQPLGIAVVGGLIVSQVLTLSTIPVTYIYMDHFSDGSPGLRAVGVRRRLATRCRNRSRRVRVANRTAGNRASYIDLHSVTK
jgi:hypothetical protein